MAVYIIAEAGVNHNGNLELAFKLCDAAKEAGADAVKFQTWKTEKIVTDTAQLARYQENNIGNKHQSQFEMLKSLELSYSQFVDIRDYCNSIGINFLSTPDEEESLEFLCSLKLPWLKVGSGEITNVPYLRKIASKKLPVILSTGMSTLAQVAIAYDTLLEYGAPSVVLLHCTSNYPCPMDEVNLKAMNALRVFGCSVGYSDHTEGIEVPIAAVAMGAEIIEKHFTLDKMMDGPDHKASLDPIELKQMVCSIRNIEKALGDGIKKPNSSEKEISKTVQKTIVASCAIMRGEILGENNLTVKRTGKGLIPYNWDTIIGTTAIRDFSIDEPIVLK
ncbi:N-acetylneuraminate synthase [Bacteroides faecichinchillae]|uniref:N-acetylneuraminate synthase n=1 Tax=Bacteroides faecichinchillae TaxID=871325 RepID=A0A1M5B8N5_9BACE|nr:N-acetylneuraminate synthase [Bacteroides faecichinchillae]THG67523.1 N-acetylneuraminate synthase [Bacteroides faecichinchillae]SHF38849.1 N-acetylneuraminate synthase [Bacteroides faecichinchillae]